MIYETYFQLPLNGYWDWSLAIPLALLILGIPFFFYRDHLRKLSRRMFPINTGPYQSLENFVYSKKFAHFWVGGVIFLGLLSLFPVHTYFKAREALLSGNFRVVEGVIHEYKAGTDQRGSAYDTFCVKDVCFEVSDWEVTSGFHQMQINDSPLKDGLPVRISYIGETIVRVEIAF